MSLLEKEARDPVEVLRVKLKDSTSTSLLNSQLVQYSYCKEKKKCMRNQNIFYLL